MSDEPNATPPISPPSDLSGGKRANLRRDGSTWIGYGKDESCPLSGPWSHLVYLAAKILRDPATEIVAPNLYRPDLVLTPEQEIAYSSDNGPEWPGEES